MTWVSYKTKSFFKWTELFISLHKNSPCGQNISRKDLGFVTYNWYWHGTVHLFDKNRFYGLTFDVGMSILPQEMTWVLFLAFNNAYCLFLFIPVLKIGQYGSTQVLCLFCNLRLMWTVYSFYLKWSLMIYYKNGLVFFVNLYHASDVEKELSIPFIKIGQRCFIIL